MYSVFHFSSFTQHNIFASRPWYQWFIHLHCQIPLHSAYATFSLSVYLLVDICASSTFWWLKIMLPWTFINHFSWNEISFIHKWEFKTHKLNYLLTLQSYNHSVNSLNLEISLLSVSGRTLPVEFMIKLCNIASSQSDIWNMKSPKKKVELKCSHKKT